MSSGLLLLVSCLWLPLIVYSASSDEVEMQKCVDLLNTQRLVYCCGKSFLDKFLFVGSNCTPFWDDYGPCRYECLYKHWDLLDQDNRVKKPEFYLMVTSLYSPLNGYYQYGNALKAAHEICDALGSRHSDFLLLYSNQMTGQRGIDSSTCLPYAMIHAKCTMIYLTANCPSENWMEERECNNLKRVLASCTNKLDEKSDGIRDKSESTDNGCEVTVAEELRLLLTSFLSLIISKFLSDF
ncbi:uncharacterized protein LOC108101612 [Drosophila ficusphila]|uniref:uncharacterized protein LOC108101612 n=1 Tax=Drosophila ficusphila TaxID=30025 RepID=UPI0007E7C710|nr:uncharacterized protein LOC108101612 [Drosophila ficusphila]